MGRPLAFPISICLVLNLVYFCINVWRLNVRRGIAPFFCSYDKRKNRLGTGDGTLK
jgi:hypothetical protein